VIVGNRKLIRIHIDVFFDQVGDLWPRMDGMEMMEDRIEGPHEMY
jgi:hypothetical protein